MKKYIKVWWIFAINSISAQMAIRWALLLFIIGKILRFGIFLFFIIILVDKTKALAGYSLDQTILFFLTFNLIDILSQLLFREVYRFRGTVLSGNFDFSLIKPYSPLFRSLTSGPDILDFITLMPLIWAIVYFISKLQISVEGIFIFILLSFVGFLLALSFHILVLALAILTTEIDNTLWMYRDITAMGRFPVDIYREPIRGILTFAIPVGIMMSFPVKGLLGLLSLSAYFYAIIFSVVIFFLSLKAWQFALNRYSSASS